MGPVRVSLQTGKAFSPQKHFYFMSYPQTPEQGPSRKEMAGAKFRAVLNLVMGVVYILLGIVVMYLKYFGTIELGALLAYFLGGLFILYGAFRIWRGVQEHKLLRGS